MWLSRYSYLYLDNIGISMKKRENYIEKHKNKLFELALKLTPEEIVYYLFESNLPESAREIICNGLNTQTNDDISKEKLEFIQTLIMEKSPIDISLLDTNYCPTFLKKRIITDYYGNDIIKIVTNDDIPISRKKLVIDLLSTEEDDIALIGMDIPSALISYIIKEKINSSSTIQNCILNDAISDKIKEDIINQKVNMDNISMVTTRLPFTKKNLVNRLKYREIEEYVDGLTSENVLSVINGLNYYPVFTEEILKRRSNSVTEAIKNASIKDIARIIELKRSEEIINLVFKTRLADVYTIIDSLDTKQIFRWLSNPYIDNELKSYIAQKHFNKIKERISRHDLSSYEKDQYLLNDSSLPNDIFLLIFNEYKDDLIKKFQGFSDYELISTFMYSNYNKTVIDLLVKTKINSTNIMEILFNKRLPNTIVDSIFEVGKDVLISVFVPFDVDELIFNTLPSLQIQDEMKKRLIIVLLPEITSILKHKSRKNLLKYLKNSEVDNEIKKSITKILGINNTEILNSIDAMDPINCKLLIENYRIIKQFMNTCKIPFISFLQYGSGSNKYSNWITDILKITTLSRDNEFAKVWNYFYNNYYSEFQEKENSVYNIANFLELLRNYNRYRPLLVNLSNHNTILDKNDKLNIRFLFQTGTKNNLNIPKTLEDIEPYKINLCKKYINDINNGNLELDEVKKIFNNFIFSNANVTLKNIGGIAGLKTLKRDNADSNDTLALINQLLLYANIIETVNNTNNLTGLKEVLECAFSDISTLMIIQNIFQEFDKKVTKLYEVDAKHHLTSLEKVKNIPGVISYQLSEKYGGLVYDFSNKNYTLYAHVLGIQENLETLISGKCFGKNNFISVSPIGYKGQKYYWDNSELVFAYDKIPRGSFICSSVFNMSTNSKLGQNSFEVSDFERSQRGILETSAVMIQNSETLLYREGLKPSGIILPGGREPTVLEMECHQKYNLPFIITQNVMEAIDNPKNIFPTNSIYTYEEDGSTKILRDLLDILKPNVYINSETDIYTGREVAIFTDAHAMWEPTLAVLEDIKKHGITEIYSLGDNVGVGPNPAEVFDLLQEYGVISIAGNSEYYNTLGIKPFTYFSLEKARSQDWTASKLGPDRIKQLEFFKASHDLVMGEKKIALCHFSNDIRWDYEEHSTYRYRENFKPGINGRQFLYTNSSQAKEDLERNILLYQDDEERARGYLKSKEEPLFAGKGITDYDAIFQGHVHFQMTDKIKDTEIYTLRGAGIAYEEGKVESACYYVLKERKDGEFDIERRDVSFNKNDLVSNVYATNMPNKSLALSYLKAK